MPGVNLLTTLLLLVIITTSSLSFMHLNGSGKLLQSKRTMGLNTYRLSKDSSWNGEVVSNSPDGRMRGCIIQKVDDALCEWMISIDGVEADLGKFSEAIYRKITTDAKKMRFQGFRPGTIPPHLIPTYIAYTMDECAREATLEAMVQNNIRPFEDARNNFKFETISIPPPTHKANKSKAKVKAGDTVSANLIIDGEWMTFTSMKEAIEKGWKVKVLHIIF